jgi:hypothetical protein
MLVPAVRSGDVLPAAEQTMGVVVEKLAGRNWPWPTA